MKRRMSKNTLYRRYDLLILVIALLSLFPLCAIADVAITRENFPDSTFRSYICSELFPAKSEGDVITDAELTGITEIYLGDYRTVASLVGIEYFVALKYLDCGSNQLTALDVSNNKALEHLSCGNNQLATLDVSNNKALDAVFCDRNQLTTLDVSNNRALEYLSCDDNQLTTLDVSNNKDLHSLYCDSNQLVALDVSNNKALETICCSGNQLTALDVSNNTVLTEFRCGFNRLTTLDVSNNRALEQLYCNNNQLTTLDASNNLALYVIGCECNQLTSLNISRLERLELLDCSQNQLTTLDVGRDLEFLFCSDNQLTALDLSQQWIIKFYENDMAGKSIITPKSRAVTSTYTENGWQLSMASLVGQTNVGRVSFVSLEEGAYDSVTGLVTLPTGNATLRYLYDVPAAVSDVDSMEVTLLVTQGTGQLPATTQMPPVTQTPVITVEPPNVIIAPTVTPMATRRPQVLQSVIYIANSRASDRLHLRIEPNSRSASKGKYYNGVVAVLLERYDDWCHVEIAGVRGYMMSRHLSDTPMPSAMPRLYVKADWIHLRADYSESSQALGQYDRGTPVTVMGVCGNWLHVQVGNQTGYMLASLLSDRPQRSNVVIPTAAPVVTRKPQALQTTIYIANPRASDRLHLRVEPDSRSASRGKYYNGVTAKLLDRSDTWCYVEIAGERGYMMSRYLSDTPVSSAMPSVYVKAERIHLREDYSKSSKSLGQYSKGTVVTVMGLCGNWLHVQVDNQTGYMLASLLSDLPTK